MDFVVVVDSEDVLGINAVPLPAVLVVEVMVDDFAVLVDAEEIIGT